MVKGQVVAPDERRNRMTATNEIMANTESILTILVWSLVVVTFLYCRNKARQIAGAERSSGAAQESRGRAARNGCKKQMHEKVHG